MARAWLLAFSRPAKPAETERALMFLQTRTAALATSGGAPKPQEAALAEFCLALFNANEFVYVD